jgi:hypothetical protein
MAMARNRVVSINGQINLYTIVDTSTTPLTDAQMDTISTFLRHQELGYDLVNVPVYESGPFPSSKNEVAKDKVEEVKLSIDSLGSTYTTYQRNGFVYSDYYTEEVSAGTWWVKAALATIAPVPGATVTATWSNICVDPGLLACWVAYADTVCDVPYVFTSQSVLPNRNNILDADGEPVPVLPWAKIISNWKIMYENNGETAAGALFDNATLMSADLFICYQICSCMYSPFGQCAYESFYAGPSIDQGNTDPWSRLLFTANWRSPVYLPSIITEAIASVAEQTIIKSTQAGITRSFQVFNIVGWPISISPDAKTDTFINLERVVTALQSATYLLTYRRFLKLNLNPEYKVNKAVMPYFFIHAPVSKSIKLPDTIVTEAFDAIVSPYSTRYIEDHNLHLLARCMFWPRVYDISQNMVVWMPIIDLKTALPDGGTWNVMEPIIDLDQLSYLCLDMSFLADGCEMDAYLNKMRTSHLGFFAALAGLLPTALKVGTALFKTIAKPKDIDKATEPPPTASTGPSVDAAQTNNMAMAGVSSLQQTTSGAAGSGGTVDLSSTVNVDPVQRVLEAGKKVVANKRVRQAVTFGGKALRFGRSFYNNYKKSQE